MEVDLSNKKKKRNIKLIISFIVSSLMIVILSFAISIYFAIGYLLCLVVHELGHIIIAKKLNKKIYFGGITPLGAYVEIEDRNDCKESFLIGIGGPLAGLFLALIYLLIFYFTKTQDVFLLAKISTILSLFNLIPLQPLDGGMVAEALSPKLCYFGFPILIYLFVNNDRLKSRVIIIMIMIVGFFMTLEYERKRKKRKYYNIDKKTKLKYTVLYGLLVVILFVLAIYLNWIY